MDATQGRPRIAIGADHGGFDLKQHLAKRLRDQGYHVDDCGTYDASPVDYPKIAAVVAHKVASGEVQRGIIIDGAGIGSCMAANKIPGVRAALCYDVSSAKNSREHNDANVLTLGARLIGPGLAEQIVDTWLKTDCTEERHLKRVQMIRDLESPTMAPAAPCGCHTRTDGAQPPPAVEKSEQAGTTAVPELMNLSDDDLDRIAARIAEMARAGQIPFGMKPLGVCSCCGPECRGHCAERNPSAVRDFLSMGAGRIGYEIGGGPIARDVAQYIDHTLLKPEATSSQIAQLCKEAREFGFASVCINPTYVSQAAKLLSGAPVKVCTVVGFPLGTHVPEIKALEARRAIRDGAREIDMVINIGALKSGDDELVFDDIRAVVDACMDGRSICKVIIECALLTDDEKVRACRAARRARADFVKTSTGFSTGGATAADVALMSEAVRGTRMGVKAAGGIRSYEDLQQMVRAGATRIGASAGVAIIQEAKGDSKSSPKKSAAAEKY